MPGQLVQRYQLPDQAGCRQHGQQESEPFQRPQQQQVRRAVRPHAADACAGQQQLAGDDAPAPPDAVGCHPEEHAQRHSGELNDRQQEAGLHEAYSQGIAQYRYRRRHLADMQCGNDP